MEWNIKARLRGKWIIFYSKNRKFVDYCAELLGLAFMLNLIIMYVLSVNSLLGRIYCYCMSVGIYFWYKEVMKDINKIFKNFKK